MTREEIERDIAALLSMSGVDQRVDVKDAIRRACQRLRTDLARIDGPADGFVRVRVGVSVSPCGAWAAAGGAAKQGASPARLLELTQHGRGDSWSWIAADVPKPRVVEVEGEVEK